MIPRAFKAAIRPPGCSENHVASLRVLRAERAVHFPSLVVLCDGSASYRGLVEPFAIAALLDIQEGLGGREVLGDSMLLLYQHFNILVELATAVRETWAAAVAKPREQFRMWMDEFGQPIWDVE